MLSSSVKRAATVVAVAPRHVCVWRTLQQSPLRRMRPAAAGQNGQPGPSSEGPLREFSAYTSVDEWKKLDSKVGPSPPPRRSR